jgi:radical SAM/Cys-rich protein
MARVTLRQAGNPLAESSTQRQILGQSCQLPRFEDRLTQSGLSPLTASGIRILQVNVGKLCNQTCRHCHVDAGPDRREVMTQETMQFCLDALDRSGIPILDITGGAPELNPHFRWLVAETRARRRHVIDRCNLTILLAQANADLPEFLARHLVEVVASLPCYLKENTDAQRGDGVFDRSIEALRRLNKVGYGLGGSGLSLTLVYNPVGPSLPPPQAKLEADYKEQLRSRFGIEFNRLYTITNMPISRFLDDLLTTGQYEEYMSKLVAAFNPDAAREVMCRTMLSVNWDGTLSDCDFNQMLELELAPGQPRHIRDFDFNLLRTRRIVTGSHCYGCTAGSGSSCRGATIP